MGILNAEVPTVLRQVAWASPVGCTLDELIVEMRLLGNTVLEVDRAGNRLKLADTFSSLTDKPVTQEQRETMISEAGE